MIPDSGSGGGGFIPGVLGDLLKMMRTDAAIQWELAVQFAQSVASDATPETNVEPAQRMELEQLLVLAELHVPDITGMTLNPSGKKLSVLATSRADWAKRSLESWRPLIQSIAGAITPPKPPQEHDQPKNALSDEADGEDQLHAFFTQWATAVTPSMIAIQVGSAIGHLAQRCLGQYELPLPRAHYDEIVVVPGNIASFAKDWTLPFDDIAMWSIARDVTINAVLGRPHVAARLSSLLVAHAQTIRPDLSALEEMFGEAGLSDMSDMSGLAGLLGNPSALRELSETDEHARIRAELAALFSALDGYADWVAANVTPRVSGASMQVREAMRRHRLERGEEARAAEALFGLSLDQEGLDRGEAFVRGVLERGGESELAKLWVIEANLPTPAEVDAPGLWIERVNLPPLDPA
jgi:putative hydrolase